MGTATKQSYKQQRFTTVGKQEWADEKLKTYAELMVEDEKTTVDF